jgi:hypothetical protein
MKNPRSPRNLNISGHAQMKNKNDHVKVKKMRMPR